MLSRKGFTCYDVRLDPGTNTIVLSCRDDAGNSFATNLTIVFTTVGDTTPPALRLDWPVPGRQVYGPRFTARGFSDDPTAGLQGQITCAGHTNYFAGIIERNGYFWFEQIPLALGSNSISLTASDAAGNSFTTNFVICGVSSPAITMDPVDDKLFLKQFIVVTGKVDPSCQELWINGAQARIAPDGTWEAMEVPVYSPNWGGTMIFSMTAVERGSGNRKIGGSGILSAQAALGKSEMVLNASNPACGVFRLHLTGTAGSPFVLEASTNLVHWTPILTNLNPSVFFDFTDSDSTNYPCRFFKVVPLQ